MFPLGALLRAILLAIGPPDALAFAAGVPACTNRNEFFLVERTRPVAAGLPLPAPEPVALIAWRRGELGRGALLERDVLFKHGSVRVLHDERISFDARGRVSRLVWRELRGRRAPGRCWIADWDRGSRELHTVIWGTRGPAHAERVLEGEAVLPLSLVEVMRRSLRDGRRVECIAPLRCGTERLVLRVRPGDARRGAGVIEAARSTGSAAGFTRTVECLREDGSLARRFVLRGEELLAFQLQEGGPWARRIPPAHYRELMVAWRLDPEAAPAQTGDGALGETPTGTTGGEGASDDVLIRR